MGRRSLSIDFGSFKLYHHRPSVLIARGSLSDKKPAHSYVFKNVFKIFRTSLSAPPLFFKMLPTQLSMITDFSGVEASRSCNLMPHFMFLGMPQNRLRLKASFVQFSCCHPQSLPSDPVHQNFEFLLFHLVLYKYLIIDYGFITIMITHLAFIEYMQ